MADVQKGCGVVWGAGGLSGTGVVFSSTTGEIQSHDLARAATTTELRNHDGDVVGMAFSDANKTLTVSVIPSHATTIAGARTNMDAMIPVNGTIVTIADTMSTISDGTHSGKYLLEGSRVRYTNSGFAVVEFDLTQYDDNDVAVDVTES